MKKLISLTLVLIMLICVGCDNKANVNNHKSDAVAQYVISLNPSVMYSDGTVVSARNDAANAMKKDINGTNNPDLYSATPWQWITASEDTTWEQRAVRNVSRWSDGSGNSNKDAPYSYKFNDSFSNSLAVYDTSKMKIDGENINKSGIIFSFTGDKEEGICFTAKEDSLIEFFDPDGGNISIVESIGSTNTSYLSQKGAEKSVLLKIYKNNRIYWQEVLDENSKSVDFPDFTGLSLAAGDTVTFTAQAVEDASDIVRGNCDLPSGYKTVKVKNRIKTSVPVEDNEKETAIPFVKDNMANFIFVKPSNCDSETEKVINEFVASLETTLDTYFSIINDSEFVAEDYDDTYCLVVGKTKLSESTEALKEIKAGREKNSGDFIIRNTGKKIIVSADNSRSLKYAANFFMNNYCKNDESEMIIGTDYVSAKYHAVKKIMIANTPIENYQIVLSRYSSYLEKLAAEYLTDRILTDAGCILKTVDDTTAAGKYELLVGYTNRSSSDYLLNADKNGENEYTIAVGNNKTSVLSGSNSAVNAGVIKLAGMLSDKVNLTVGSYTGKYDGGYTLAGGYKLAWSDEFNGTTLSGTWKKNISGGTATNGGGITIPSFENHSLKDGALEMKTEKRGNDVYFPAIEATGKNSVYFKYGYIETRIKLSKDIGYCGSLWMLTINGPKGIGEFDIFENFGKIDTLKPNLHIWAEEKHTNIIGQVEGIGNDFAGFKYDEPLGNAYHYIGMDWTPEYVTFYIDGIPKISVDISSSEFDALKQYAYPILSFAGDELYQKRPVKTNETYNYIDWVRIWQRDEQGYGIKIK